MNVSPISHMKIWGLKFIGSGIFDYVRFITGKICVNYKINITNLYGTFLIKFQIQTCPYRTLSLPNERSSLPFSNVPSTELRTNNLQLCPYIWMLNQLPVYGIF